MPGQWRRTVGWWSQWQWWGGRTRQHADSDQPTVQRCHRQKHADPHKLQPAEAHPLCPCVHSGLQYVVQYGHPSRTNYLIKFQVMWHKSAHVIINWRALWKNRFRICSTTMKLRKSLVKPVMWQKTCNYIELFGSSTRDHHARHIYWQTFRE